MAGTLSELRQFFATRIAASSTSGLGQGTITSRTWKEERSPFALLDEPKARTHLAFSCQVSDATFVVFYDCYLSVFSLIKNILVSNSHAYL